MAQTVKAFACNVGDLGLIPGSGRSPGEGNGNPLQYSCLKIPWREEPGGLQSMGATKGQTRLSDFTFTFIETWQKRPSLGQKQARKSENREIDLSSIELAQNHSGM